MKYKKAKTIKDLGENLDKLVDVLNHRVTKLETSTNWIKWILGYVAVILTGVMGVAISNTL